MCATSIVVWSRFLARRPHRVVRVPQRSSTSIAPSRVQLFCPGDRVRSKARVGAASRHRRRMALLPDTRSVLADLSGTRLRPATARTRSGLRAGGIGRHPAPMLTDGRIAGESVTNAASKEPQRLGRSSAFRTARGLGAMIPSRSSRSNRCDASASRPAPSSSARTAKAKFGHRLRPCSHWMASVASGWPARITHAKSITVAICSSDVLSLARYLRDSTLRPPDLRPVRPQYTLDRIARRRQASGSQERRWWPCRNTAASAAAP